MKIMIADVLLKGKPHADWKEGYELCYALRNLGHECDVFGPNGENSELEIYSVYNKYDLIIITENYPAYSGWRWWNWSEVKKPKVFWGFDTHLIDFNPFIKQSNIDFIIVANKENIPLYKNVPNMYLPYGISKKRYDKDYSISKKRDLVFIGTLFENRRITCEKFGIENISAFGEDYIREMQSSKICYNELISYGINAKYFEIIASGSFMLAQENSNFLEYVDNNQYIQKMFFKDEKDFQDKITYYLENEVERENICKIARKYVLERHTWESRMINLLDELKRINII